MVSDPKQTTKRPWRVFDAYWGEKLDAYLIVAGTDGENGYMNAIAEMRADRADAELIVRAVNAHDDLEAALREVTSWARVLTSTFSPENKDHPALLTAEALVWGRDLLTDDQRRIVDEYARAAEEESDADGRI